MLASLLTISALLSIVAGFTPPQPPLKPIHRNVEEMIVSVDALQSQPRNKNVSLRATLGTGLDPMFTTVLLGAVLLGTMVAYEEGEYTVMSNSAKSLVADKGLDETVEAAIAEANKATDFEIDNLNKESSGEAVVEAVEHIVEEKTAEPVKQTVEKEEAAVFDVEAEREKLAKIFSSVEEPAAKVEIESESITPFVVKIIVKVIMPWRKFSKI